MTKISLDKIKAEVSNSFRCVDCNTKSKFLLPCTRNGKDFVQCCDCFETFTQWSLGTLSANEVRGIFHERQVLVMKNLGYQFIPK